MNVPIAHHYLTRFYLDAWVGSRGKVTAFSWKGAERIAWTKFLMAQKVRTPDVVARIRREGIEYLNRALDEKPEEWERIKGARPERTLREWAEKNAPGLGEKVAMTRMLPNQCVDPKTGSKILNMMWQVIDFPDTSPELLTCDRPVMLTHGIDSPDCWLILPLGPHQLFIATHGEGLKVTDPNRAIRDTNRNVVRSALQRVWGRDERHAPLVRKWLKKRG